MKLIISTIVTGIVLFLLGWVLYGFIFMDFFKVYYSHLQRSPGDMKIWAIGVSCLLQGFFLAFLYPKFYKSGSGFSAGLKFGFYIGLFVGIPYIFSMWATMPITYKAVLVDAAILIVMMIIAGIITGLVYGNSLAAKTKETAPASL
jgi:hypothetical protein